MLTKRDSLVALLTVCATLAVVTLGQTEKPLMGSSVFRLERHRSDADEGRLDAKILSRRRRPRSTSLNVT